MTPGARVAAATAVLDAWSGGEAAERALIRWARGARYAGSGDRAAVRDHVYSALRRLRSSAALGGGTSGRAIMLGLLAGRGEDPSPLFDGRGHAPAPLTPDEAARLADPPPLARAERLDVPDWLLPTLDDDLGARCEPVLEALRDRAPLHLRANLARGTRAEVAAALAGEGVEARPHALSPSALEVVSGGRGLRGTRAFADGLVEPQDAASQAVADLVPTGGRVLDLCAGGGGKSLALAASGAEVHAWDVDPDRMRPIPERAARAGARIAVLDRPPVGRWDAVLVDAPCSGSGSWRRDPEGKWRLTPKRLDALRAAQDDVLARACPLVAPGGAMVYATCSLLSSENEARWAGLGWREDGRLSLTPLEGGDGFGAARLRRDE